MKIGTNTSHFSYQYLIIGEKYARSQVYIEFMCIPHIDKIPAIYVAFCSGFQFFTVLPLTSVTIKYQFFTYVIMWYQFIFSREYFVDLPVLHTCEFCHTFFTRDDLTPIFQRCEDLVPILHTCENLVPILHICERMVQLLHI